MNRSISSTILDELSRQLEVLPKGRDARLILGVSGGPDSMSLLYACSRLDLDVIVVHCNYQLRGRDSDHDQQLVEETGSMWGFDVISLRLDPSEAENRNFQDWARRRRYQIFHDLKREQKADAISTAHHQDDQLETIIQKILRGAGLTAWKGMEVWSGELFRPLLGVSKANLLQFASTNHIPYRLDNSNEESTYARNFLRNGWFPVLDDLFPGWRENMLKIPERAREHGAVVRSLLASLRSEDGTIFRDRLLSLPADVQKPLLLEIVKSVDPEQSISAGALANLERLDELQTGQRLELNAELSVTRDRDRFVLTREESLQSKTEELRKDRLIESEQVSGHWMFNVIPWIGQVDESMLQMDADRIEWPLVRRRWRNGDRFNPFGLSGHQTVADHLTNQKVPAHTKRSADVLEGADGKIVAVLFPPDTPSVRPGTIADWVRCEDQTDHSLVIKKVVQRSAGE